MKGATLQTGKLTFSAQLVPDLSFRFCKQSKGQMSCNGLFANKTLRKKSCGSEMLSETLVSLAHVLPSQVALLLTSEICEVPAIPCGFTTLVGQLESLTLQS